VPEQQRQLAQHISWATRGELGVVAGVIGQEKGDLAVLDVEGRLGCGALFDELVAITEFLRLPCGVEYLLNKRPG